VSICEIFNALSSAPGDVAVLVKARVGDRWMVDVVVDGRPVLGLVPRPVAERLRLGQPGDRFYGIVDGVEVHAEVVLIRPTVVAVGRGEVARRVAEVAAAMGYAVVSIGHAARGALEAKFEDLEELVGEHTVVVVANEGGDPMDVDVAELAIRRRARYVAVMASQRRAALILRELERRGVPKEELERRLYTPAGLDIGAKTAGEIAVSILAEAVAALRGGTGRSLREMKNPRSVLKEVEGESLADYKCDWRPPRGL